MRERRGEGRGGEEEGWREREKEESDWNKREREKVREGSTNPPSFVFLFLIFNLPFQ